jgi:hypothetical protein
MMVMAMVAVVRCRGEGWSRNNQDQKHSSK